METTARITVPGQTEDSFIRFEYEGPNCYVILYDGSDDVSAWFKTENIRQALKALAGIDDAARV